MGVEDATCDSRSGRGGGLVGGALASGALARAGHPVTLVVRPGRGEQYPKRLSVQSQALGSFESPVEVAERLGEP
jgi:2-polyprenyl-6-methoxyphenol hydroxylase-like FAD-dependent oxidoreductase